jgi:hypothetical protein
MNPNIFSKTVSGYRCGTKHSIIYVKLYYAFGPWSGHCFGPLPSKFLVLCPPCRYDSELMWLSQPRSQSRLPQILINFMEIKNLLCYVLEYILSANLFSNKTQQTNKKRTEEYPTLRSRYIKIRSLLYIDTVLWLIRTGKNTSAVFLRI